MKPNEQFDNVRPDEVAECWDGVDQETYRELWGLMKYLPPPPRSPEIEDLGPEPAEGKTSLSYYWDRLSPTAQAKLNALAEAEDEKFNQWADEAAK